MIHGFSSTKFYFSSNLKLQKHFCDIEIQFELFVLMKRDGHGNLPKTFRSDAKASLNSCPCKIMLVPVITCVVLWFS